MSKKKPDLEINGELTWAKNEAFPKPGKAKFNITGMDDSRGKILLERQLNIRIDQLPEVVTAKHIRGDIRIRLWKQEPDNEAYKKDVQDRTSAKTRGKKAPEIEKSEE